LIHIQEKQSITNHIISILDDRLDKKEVGMIGAQLHTISPPLTNVSTPSTFFAVAEI
jgi:hypothetical protein